MASPRGSIGIDFGTSNTHFAFSNLIAGAAPEPRPLNVFGAALVPSCVLWKKPCTRDESLIVAIGSQAEAGWFELDEHEQAAHRLAANFKPDLLRSEQARTDAWAFLRKAYRGMRADNATDGIGADEGMPVVIGVPAEIGDEQKRFTAQAGCDAGFGEVVCVDEPLGALAFHLKNGDIMPHEARDGVLIVDFGGGTLDVALINAVARGFRKPWGEPTLGGRLFDDLFYTWVLQQNPGLKIAPEDLGPFWLLGCRKIKEKFSRDWSGGQLQKKYRVEVLSPPKVFLHPESVDEFERRARSFTPSKIAQDYFRSVGGRTASLADLRNANLFDWIEKTVRGDQDQALHAGEFSKVLLTGGSCAWPFMKPLVARTLAIPDTRIKTSADPLTAVGMGLTIYLPLRDHYRAQSKAIEGERGKKTTDFAVRIDARMTAFSERLAKRCVDEIIAAVRSRFHCWYDNGGVLDDVASLIDADVEVKKPLIESIIHKEYDTLTIDLDRIRIDFIKDWLKDHGVARSPQELGLAERDIKSPGEMEFEGSVGKISQEMAAVTTAVAGVAAGIVVIVVSLVKGKVILALFLANPVLGVMAGILALVGGAVLNDWLKEKVAKHDWQGLRFSAMKLALSKAKIDAALDETAVELKVKLQREIRSKLKSLDSLLLQQFSTVTDRVLEDLTVLEDFRERGSGA
jgi:hypothetical protein